VIPSKAITPACKIFLEILRSFPYTSITLPHDETWSNGAMKMNIKIITWLTAILSLLAPGIARGVVVADRNMILNPLAHKIDESGTQFLPLIGGWGEIDKYWKIADDGEHNFNTRIGVAAEAVRIGDDYDFTVSSDVELVANGQGALTFNPRAFFWQEAFMFGAAMADSFLQLGYVHRCKHDVDNIEVQDTTGERRELVLIYDSVFARWISGRFALTSSSAVPLAAQIYLRADIFVLTVDDRSIEKPQKNVTNLRNGFTAGLNCTMFHIWGMLIQSRFRYSAYTFASGFKPAGGKYRELSQDWSAEASVTFPGKAGALSLFMDYEKQGCTMINPVNKSSYLVFFGARLMDTGMYD
jgi:hypothetical protein